MSAGPGDAELLTLKRPPRPQAADVILLDNLVSGEVLEPAARPSVLAANAAAAERQDINAIVLGSTRLRRLDRE